MTTATVPMCPKCGGPMWDETKSKFYKTGKPTAKCKDKTCTGVLWATNGNGGAPAPAAPARQVAPDFGGPLPGEEDDKFTALVTLHMRCFHQAKALAASTATVATLEGISALTAQLFIAARDAGL